MSKQNELDPSVRTMVLQELAAATVWCGALQEDTLRIVVEPLLPLLPAAAKTSNKEQVLDDV